MDVKVVTENTVGILVEYRKKKFLNVNREYQRGLRWSDMQKKMFIDSIFRGYSIPAFYFHKKELSAGPMTSTHYEIVDGQQRVDAIYSYSEGAFPLLNPSDGSGFKFPNFVKDDECPWGGKRFKELSEDLKKKLLNHKIVAYEITTTNENEIRDLFIRLQGGTPLTPQDKRDSWPGNFTDFVLRIGGKTGVEKWYGLPLFKEQLKAKNESTRRHIVAQIFMLFWARRKEKKFCELQSSNIDEFYHRHIDFNEESNEAKIFEKICKQLYQSFREKPKIVGHHLIHLFLLTDSLLDNYRSGTWENHLAQALHKFETRCKQAVDDVKKDVIDPQWPKYWTHYAQWTRASADKASSIQRRHSFFSIEISKLIPSLQRLDAIRNFTEFERETVFFRDLERCQYCLMNSKDHKVPWAECEIHHVRPHTEGGATSMDNATLVHKNCHPKAAEDVKKFSEWWSIRSQVIEDERKNSGHRTRHATKRMQTKIREGKFIVDFDDGKKKEWALPEKDDVQKNRIVRDEITGWARSQEATKGQVAAIVKVLNNEGYRVKET